jgi:hypothetical protein
VELRTVDVELRTVDAGLRTVDAEPQTLDAEPRTVVVELRTLDVGPPPQAAAAIFRVADGVAIRWSIPPSPGKCKSPKHPCSTVSTPV